MSFILIFLRYGKALRAAGHRVRLATHEKFRKFVRDNGLEFFPLSGDPTEMMSFMVENSGIIPSISTIVKGDLFRRRRIFSDILNSAWFACIRDDDETGAPFRAEAIIANPISYGHIHCAQKLGIPLHMVFTMPSSPTSAFPHPLSNVSCSKTPREQLNIFSYSFVDTLVRVFLSREDVFVERTCFAKQNRV
jgi:UDP:flavonoid glycosyltransferase YjiC (YdhE family)